MSVLILVVDDEADVADLFRQQFRRELRSGRFVMDFARSGAEALEHLEVPEGTTLILVLSDINMPGMTGLELLPKIKDARPNVPVIMITAYGDPETKKRVTEAGAAGLFTKPLDFAGLRQEVDRRIAEVDHAE
jgi:CheY-like chemotaxis protein